MTFRFRPIAFVPLLAAAALAFAGITAGGTGPGGQTWSDPDVQVVAHHAG